VNIEDILVKIEQGIVKADPDFVKNTLSGMEIDRSKADEIFQTLARGLETARQNLKTDRSSIPEFLLSIDAFKAGVRYLNETIPDYAGKKKESRIVIGVVEGDVHDLGKNIIASVLGCSGFPVSDLGKEVTGDMFISGIQQHDASIVALSSMMSTSLENMKKIVQRVQREYPHVRTLVGGAVVNREIAAMIGSDGFADSAITVVEEVERILLQS